MRLAAVSVTALSLLAVSCLARERPAPPSDQGSDPRRPSVQAVQKQPARADGKERLAPRTNDQAPDRRGSGVQAAQMPPPRRDGNWKVTVQADLPGVPQKPPPITFTQCVTKEDAEDPAKLVPLASPGQAPPAEKEPDEKPAIDCKVTDQKLDGARVSWTTRCESLNPMTGVGEFTYGADRYVGTMKVTMSRGDQPVTITMNYSASRLGDCAKSGRSVQGAPPVGPLPLGRAR
jgi:hypothetical protein